MLFHEKNSLNLLKLRWILFPMVLLTMTQQGTCNALLLKMRLAFPNDVLFLWCHMVSFCLYWRLSPGATIIFFYLCNIVKWQARVQNLYTISRYGKVDYIIQYIPRNMHTVFALLCFVVVIHWLMFPYPSGLLHWHCGNLTIAPVPAKQPWWIWINTSREFIMNDCITTTKQSTTKPCAYFLGYTVHALFWNSNKEIWLSLLVHWAMVF